MTSSRIIPKIILDTDPGGDDIFAFFWLQSLVKQGLAELIAVTTTAGNVSGKKTFSNASQILALGELPHVEVGRGVAVQRAAEDAAHIHGSDGMGNLSITLPPPTHDYATARDSDEIIVDRLTAMPHEVTIVAIGPLSNLAAAEVKCPGILKKAKEIVIMGGAFSCPGNVAPHGEFNIWFNPEAAETVLNSRDDVVVIPLDVTRHLIFTREMARSLSLGERSPNQTNSTLKMSQFMVDLCEFMIGTALSYRETSGISGFLVHDAATLGYLFYPETLTFRRAHVRAETKGEWTRGQTLIDDRRGAKTDANAWIAWQVDTTEFFTRFVEDLKVLVQPKSNVQ